MDILLIIKWVLAAATVLTGLISLLRPLSVRGFTGLEAPGPRGITEIRAVLGGVFIAIGLAPMWLNDPKAFLILGFTYLVVGAVRAVSMVIDRSIVRSNLISLIVELVFGILLIL